MRMLNSRIQVKGDLNRFAYLQLHLYYTSTLDCSLRRVVAYVQCTTVLITLCSTLVKWTYSVHTL
jgi:hypothetical protein